MREGSKAFQQASDKLGVMQQRARGLNDTLSNTRTRMMDLEAQTKRNNTAFAAFWQSSRMGALGFNGTLLSLLFFGMEMKRVFGGALRSIFDGYKKIIPESHKFNVMTTKLSANWEFFKFQLADAMANSKLFQRFIQFLIQIIQKFQGLGENTKVVLVSLLAIGVALGGILFTVGVWGMGMAAISDMVTATTLGFGKMGGAVKGISFAKFVKGGLILAAVAGAIYLAKSAFDKFADSSDYARDKSKQLKQGWLSILNQVINPTTIAIDKQKISLKNLSEVGVYFGAVLSNAFALIGMAASFLIMVVRQVYNALTGLIKLIGTGFLTSIEALLDGFAAVADVVGWDKEAASARRYANDIDSITQSLNRMIAQDLNDMGGSVKDFMDTGDLLMGSLVSPAKAVREYREELARLEQQQKQQTSMTDSILSQNAKRGNTTSQTTNVQQNIIVDSEGTPIASAVQTPEQQAIWDRLQELGREYGNIRGN
jgi:methyl-accepting chemotaxis protein